MALTGDLRNIGLADLFQTLHQNRATGILEVVNRESRKTLVFSPAGVSLTSRRTLSGFRLGKRLIGLGKVTVDDLKVALAAQARDGGLLGELLVAAGCCTEQDIQEVIQYHVEEDLFELFTWTEGTFSFREGGEPTKEDLSGPYAAIAMDPGQAILDAARRIDECHRAWDQLPDRGEILIRSSQGNEPLDEGEWRIEARAIYNLLDGTRTISDLLDDLFISEFDAVPTLVQLLNQGLIRKRTVSELTSAASVQSVRGDHEGAVTCLKAALIQRPDDPDLLTSLCTAYQKMGDKAAAAAVLQHIAQLRYGARDLDAAAELLTVAARYAPGSPEVHEQLAMVLSQKGDEAGALAAYLSAGEILNEQQQFGAAGDLCALGLELDPNDIKLRNTLANAYLGAGDPQAAVEQLIQLVPAVEAGGSRRQIEDVYRRILQLDSSRREYLARLERVTLEGIRRRRRVKLAAIAGSALLIISSLAVVMMPGGEDTDALLAQAWSQLKSGDPQGAKQLADRIIEEDPGTEAATQARNIIAAAERSRQEAEGPKVAARNELAQTLERLFDKADRDIAEGLFGPGIASLLEAVQFTQAADTRKQLEFIGTREGKAMLADCRKQTVDMLKAYVSGLTELIRKTERELVDLRNEKLTAGEIGELRKAFQAAERLRQATDPAVHERGAGHAEEAESIICSGSRDQSKALLKAIDELRKVNDEVTERYHTLRASVLRSDLCESFTETIARVSELKGKGKLKEAREACALHLAECDRLRTERPAGYYAPVAESLLGEGGRDLDGKMAAEMELIDQVLRDIDLAEQSILEGHHEQANALLRSLIRNNFRIDFRNLVRLVLWIRTSPPGAEVTISWNAEPETSLGRTTEGGIVLRYPPLGTTVVRVVKDTFEPITLEIHDFTDEHPAAPLFRLEKQVEWKAAGVGPQQARPQLFRNSVLLAGRDGHIRTLDADSGSEEMDHNHGLLSGFAAPPLLIGDVAWMACLDQRLVAFDLRTRKNLHEIECEGRLRTSPLAVGSAVVVVDENGLVRSFVAGTERWSRRLNARVVSEPAASGRAIFLATSAGTVFALSPSTGDVLWSAELGEPIHSPVVLDPSERPIVATESGTVRLLQAETGHELWRAQLDNAARGCPAVRGDHVWVCTLSGSILSLSLEDGSVAASISSPHGVPIDRGPLFDDDRLYIVDSNGKLGCLDLDGNQLWRADLETSSATAPVLEDGRIYVGTSAGTVYCFRR